jgi:hypothetical protein
LSDLNEHKWSLLNDDESEDQIYVTHMWIEMTSLQFRHFGKVNWPKQKWEKLSAIHLNR